MPKESGLLLIERGRRVIGLGACYEDAAAEAVEAGQSVGAAFDHFDFVDHAFGVAVRGGFVEVGEQLLPPVAQVVAEGEEGGDLRPFGCVEEELEPALGVLAAVGAVDRAEAFLQSPGLGDERG